MSANKVKYPGPGCMVEFMQGNSPMQALVLEEQGGRLRLYAINRRESSMPASRLLPWSGPLVGAGLSRQRMDELLEEHKKRRAALAAEVSPLEVWELIQGEVDKASAEWMAGLVWEQPDIDQEAALGYALLAAKTHFRFSPPHFEVFPRAVVEARLQEAEAARAREVFAVTGAQFFQRLWDVHCRKRPPLSPADFPDQELTDKCRSLIFEHLVDPDATENAAVWKLLIKALPESPHLPLHLAVAWGLVPEHYNFWLDRIGFDRGEAWAEAWAEDGAAIRDKAEAVMRGLMEESPLPPRDAAGSTGDGQSSFTAFDKFSSGRPDYPFVSIDPLSTKDRDDAFFVEKTPDGGFDVRIALACPASAWPFGGGLDKAVLRRGASLYLPEGNEHMLPAAVGRSLFSLDAGVVRLGLILGIRLSAEGEALAFEPRLGLARVRDNLDLESCEAILDGTASLTGGPEGRADASDDSPLARAGRHASMLRAAHELAGLLQARRVAAGAVITERPDPEIRLQGQGEDVQVSIVNGSSVNRAHLVVGELMVLANSLLAAWAREHGIPLLYRTQDVALPREFAGVWTEPHEISRVVRVLPPASLESAPRRHAGLGMAAYATLSSSLRRYADLLNQGQVISFLQDRAPRLDAAALSALLPMVSARLDAAAQVQRFRPRYWKLLFFRQQGDKKWWDAVVAEENEAFVTIALPWAQLMVRGRRRQFDEKIYAGMRVQVRLGKVQPLLNEIQVVEAREA